MEVNALRGIAKNGAGVTLYNYFTEFGITQTSIDFVLGTAGTKVQQKVRSVIRDIETNLKGEMMASVHALVSPEFFDKLIGHSATQTAYQYYSATGAQPLREDAFSIGLAATFIAWYAFEKTLSIHSIYTFRREAFYWLAILMTFALGTSAGDQAAEGLGLGYLVSGLMYGA